MVELRNFEGDASEFAALCASVRRHEGNTAEWSPMWDAPFVRGQIDAPARNRELMVAAYDGNRLVGAFFAVPYEFIVRGDLISGSFSTCFIVDPNYRALGPYLVEELRRRHRDAGLAMSLGFVMGGHETAAGRFWKRYAEMAPKKCRFVGEAGLWGLVIDAKLAAGIGFAELSRLAEPRQRASDASLRVAEPSVSVRPYRKEDLPACLTCLRRVTAKANISIRWTAENLSILLGGEGSRTLVAQRHDEACGFVHYHRLPIWHGARIAGAVIDLLATDTRDGDLQNRLVAAARNSMADTDVQVAIALRSRMFPARLMVPAGFLPLPSGLEIVVLFAHDDINIAPFDTFELLLR